MYYSMKIDESRPFCLWGKHLFKQRFHGIFRKYWNQNWKFTILSFNWQVKMFNPIRAGGHTFFRWLFLLEKRDLEVQNFVTFPNSFWTFRKSKIFFRFFTVFWGDLEGAGWFSNIQEPRFIRVNLSVWLSVYDCHNFLESLGQGLSI